MRLSFQDCSTPLTAEVRAGACSWFAPVQHDQIALQINLTPSQSPDLLTPLTSEDQQPNDVAELIIPSAAQTSANSSYG